MSGLKQIRASGVSFSTSFRRRSARFSQKLYDEFVEERNIHIAQHSSDFIVRRSLNYLEGSGDCFCRRVRWRSDISAANNRRAKHPRACRADEFATRSLRRKMATSPSRAGRRTRLQSQERAETIPRVYLADLTRPVHSLELARSAITCSRVWRAVPAQTRTQ